MDFLKEMAKGSVREQLYAFEVRSDLDEWLRSNNYGFSDHEFENAVNVMHMNCAGERDAAELMDRVEWFRMLRDSLR